MTSSSDDGLEKAIRGMGEVIRTMADLHKDHPGFMPTDSGFEVLHANWPAYPTGHGLEHALAALANYPPDTEFFPVDEIDHCRLFIVDREPPENPYDPKYFHVAIWDEDIRRMVRRCSVAFRISSAASCSVSNFSMSRSPARSDWRLSHVPPGPVVRHSTGSRRTSVFGSRRKSSSLSAPV